MKTSVSVAALDHVPWADVVKLVQLADVSGYETLWLGEGYGWDAAPLLGDLARATHRIGLATGVANVFSRSPAQLGQFAATIDMLSGGRFTLGLGASGPGVVEGWHGIPFERGVRRLREYVDIIRAVMRGEKVTYHGELFQLPGKVRMLAHGPREIVPIYIASISALGIRLTGEIADGWLPAWVSPAHFDDLLRHDLAEGAARANRAVTDVATCVVQNVFVADDRAAAYDLARRRVALYVGGMGPRDKNFYNDLFRRYGLDDAASRVQQAFLGGRRREAEEAVSDEMVDMVATVGSPSECRQKIDAFAAYGVDEVALRMYVPSGAIDDLVQAVTALAPQD